MLLLLVRRGRKHAVGRLVIWWGRERLRWMLRGMLVLVLLLRTPREEGRLSWWAAQMDLRHGGVVS
jgi:hypothetical protein